MQERMAWRRRGERAAEGDDEDGVAAAGEAS